VRRRLVLWVRACLFREQAEEAALWFILFVHDPFSK
jgi:hypothetical protein